MQNASHRWGRACVPRGACTGSRAPVEIGSDTVEQRALKQAFEDRHQWRVQGADFLRLLQVARAIERAEKTLGPGRVKYVHPDCGFWMLKRNMVDRKIRALVEGRDLFEGRT